MFLRVRSQLSSRADTLLGLAGITAVFVLWCTLTYTGVVPPIFLPSPSGIARAIADFSERQWLWPAIWNSFRRVMVSLLLVIGIGVPLGIAMGAIPEVDAVLRKIVNSGKSIPTTGIVGLIVLWFSIEERAKIVFLVLGALFYMILLVKNAVTAVGSEYVDVARDLGASESQIVTRVLLPGALPRIWDAISVSNSIMWTYIVLAEFINSSEDQLGLGYLLYIGSRTQDSGKVFAALLIIAIIASTTDFVLHTVRRRYLDW
jgi:NitT/TauT family transport system permease protein